MAATLDKFSRPPSILALKHCLCINGPAIKSPQLDHWQPNMKLNTSVPLLLLLLLLAHAH